MVLTKDELIAALKTEVRLLLHLVSKAEPGMLVYRPAPKQRSLIELLRYLTIVGPIHLRAVLRTTGSLDMDAWRSAWQAGEAAAKARGLEEVKEELGRQAAIFDELLGPVPDGDLRTEIELFGRRASRGSMLVWLVLSHYPAYRMQVFLYLKACGREELNTLNLWAGVDQR